MMFSSSCKKSNCGARKFAEKAKGINPLKSGKQFATNPASIYCNLLNGKIIIGKDKSNSENAFCQANDKTMVNLSSLGE